MHDPYPQAKDDQHLQLLSVFHYVLAGLMGLLGCLPLIHLTVGVFLLLAPDDLFPPDPSGHPGPPLRLMGAMFTGMALAFIVLYWTLALMSFFAGRYIAGRRNHTFCLIAAGACCLFMPIGTVLGVFTIIVLMRPSVKAMFEENAMRAAKMP